MQKRRKKKGSHKFVLAWAIAFCAGVILVLIPDTRMSQELKVLSFFALFPFVLLAWALDVVRDGSFWEGDYGWRVERQTQPVRFWMGVGCTVLWAVAIAVFVVYRLVKYFSNA